MRGILLLSLMLGMIGVIQPMVSADIQQQATQGGIIKIDMKPGQTLSFYDLPEEKRWYIMSTNANSKVKFEVSGDISSLIEIPKEVILENANSWSEPNINVTIPADTQVGTLYSGSLKAIEQSSCENCNVNNLVAVSKAVEITVISEGNSAINEKIEVDDKDNNISTFAFIGGIGALIVIAAVWWLY